MDWVNVISTLGFPIVVSCACGYYVKYITDMHEKSRKESELIHKEEMNNVTDALNNNTLALNKLIERLNYKSIMEDNDNEIK